MKWTIYGVYQGNREEIDSAETLTDAKHLAREYRLAFGSAWAISIKCERA